MKYAIILFFPQYIINQIKIKLKLMCNWNENANIRTHTDTHTYTQLFFPQIKISFTHDKWQRENKLILFKAHYSLCLRNTMQTSENFITICFSFRLYANFLLIIFFKEKKLKNTAIVRIAHHKASYDGPVLYFNLVLRDELKHFF